MSNYVLETGAVLLLAWMVLILDGVIVFGLMHRYWLLLLAVPPVAGLHYAIVDMWLSRPSLFH